jgi:hypothetical protein
MNWFSSLLQPFFVPSRFCRRQAGIGLTQYNASSMKNGAALVLRRRQVC